MRQFDLCVIGSGSGNTIIDGNFAEQRVALVDSADRFGGTCLNVGCIPTKMFVVPADLARTPDEAIHLGVRLGQAEVNFPAIRDRIFDRIDPISQAGEAWREQNENVTLFREAAHFVGPKRLQVGDETITANKIVIAAGSRPIIPDLPGLDDPDVAARVHTSETVMRISKLPRSMVIVGGGVVAAEFAHIFSAFGAKVTLLSRSDVLLRHEDERISEVFTELLAERVNVRLRQRVVGLTATERDSVYVETVDPDGISYDFETELVLMATGRRSNSDLLDVSAAGIAVDEAGRIVVDKHLQTSVPGIFALGDVTSPDQLKHVANYEARVVKHNLLHPRRMIARDGRPVPHAVFSDPQIASVGLTEQEARAAGKPYVTAVHRYAAVAYGWAMEDRGHLVKLLADPVSKQVIGAHIIGPQASMLIQPLIQAMTFKLDVPTMARDQYWIHPALTEVVENALLALKLR